MSKQGKFLRWLYTKLCICIASYMLYNMLEKVLLSSFILIFIISYFLSSFIYKLGIYHLFSWNVHKNKTSRMKAKWGKEKKKVDPCCFGSSWTFYNVPEELPDTSKNEQKQKKGSTVVINLGVSPLITVKKENLSRQMGKNMKTWFWDA